MRLVLLLLLFPLAIFANLGASADNLGSLKASSFTVKVGGGYASDMQMPSPYICFNVKNSEFTGPSSSVLSFGNRITDSKLQQVLNISATGSASYGAFSASASTDYYHEVKTNDYSQSFTFLNEIVFPALSIFVDPTDPLNTTGKAFYQDGKGPYFRIMCGDEYYAQLQEGASLLATVKINFSSREEKEKFSAEISAGVSGIGSASAAIQKEVNKHHLTGSVEVLAYQLGGDPTQLAHIMSKDKHGHYYITRCNLSDLNACTNAIDGILKYASENFSKQLAVVNGKVVKYDEKASVANIDKPMSLSVNFLPGLNAGKTLVTEGVSNARKALVTAVENARYHYANADTILSYHGDMLANDIKLEISSDKANADYNLSLLNNNAEECYTNIPQCVALAQQLKGELKPYSDHLYDYFTGALNDAGISSPLTMSLTMPFQNSTIEAMKGGLYSSPAPGHFLCHQSYRVYLNGIYIANTPTFGCGLYHPALPFTMVSSPLLVKGMDAKITLDISHPPGTIIGNYSMVVSH